MKRVNRKRQRGAVFIEAALGVPIFLLVVFSGVDLGRIAYHSICLDYVVSRSARWATLGKQTPGLTREASIEQHLIQNAHTYGITLLPSEVRICPVSSPACTVDSAGGANEHFLVMVSHQVPCLFGIVKPALTASALEKSEPYA